MTSLKLADDPSCERGVLEDSDHIMFDCKLFDNERVKLRNKCLDKGIEWPADKLRLMTKDIFPDMKQVATDILKKKEEENAR